MYLNLLVMLLFNFDLLDNGDNLMNFHLRLAVFCRASCCVFLHEFYLTQLETSQKNYSLLVI